MLEFIGNLFKKMTVWRWLTWGIAMFSLCLFMNTALFHGESWIARYVSQGECLAFMSGWLGLLFDFAVQFAMPIGWTAGILSFVLGLLGDAAANSRNTGGWRERAADLLLSHDDGEPSFWVYQGSIGEFAICVLQLGVFAILVSIVCDPSYTILLQVGDGMGLMTALKKAVTALTVLLVSLGCIKEIAYDYPRYSFYEMYKKMHVQY